MLLFVGICMLFYLISNEFIFKVIMKNFLIKEASLVNEGKIFSADVFIKEGRIEQIANSIQVKERVTEVLAEGKLLLPGVIDDQVHFREPGLTHKANIYSESRAAVAGGTTSFMEMPNTIPNALTQKLLEDKYQIASNTSLANYSFFMGTSNDNYEEVMRTDLKNVCGLKIFMGSSTGNMLVDNENTLSKIFSNFEGLIATHCEDEATVLNNLELFKRKYTDRELPSNIHALIRNEEACLKSSSFAVELAKKNGTRLHILHISSSDEIKLFNNNIPLKEKKITSEVCVHHLWFDAEDYERLQWKIKCNPAIKAGHKEKLFEALLSDHFDIIATDHAPHLLSEKEGDYWHAHAGLPLVQHSLQVMLDFYEQGKISLPKLVEKMCHAPADCFNIKERGYLREGYFADLVMVDKKKTTVSKETIYAKCGWSPFEGHAFSHSVHSVWVNGNRVFEDGLFTENIAGKRLVFKC